MPCTSLTSVLTAAVSFLAVSSLAILSDTQHYQPTASFLTVLKSPTITPLNLLLYNASSSNLSTHGLHPWYQHILINFPQLLGPALFLLPHTLLNSPTSLPTFSILSSLVILSLIPHQEARFLLPLAPLTLSILQIPHSTRHTRYFLAAWVLFNTLFATLMGTFHQGGVIPAQIWLGTRYQQQSPSPAQPLSQIFWWKTYPPPIYLLGKTNNTANVTTTDLMGMPFAELQTRLLAALGPCSGGSGAGGAVGLVAPYSSTELDAWARDTNDRGTETQPVQIEELWRWQRHLNLDDMDFEADGVVATLRRVLGRRGLVVWRVERTCGAAGGGKAALGSDW